MPGKLELHSRRRLHFNARVAIIPLKSAHLNQAHESRQHKTLSWFEASGLGAQEFSMCAPLKPPKFVMAISIIYIVRKGSVGGS